MYYDRDVQPFPDDRYLTRIEELFDQPVGNPVDSTPDAADDYQAAIRHAVILDDERITELFDEMAGDPSLKTSQAYNAIIMSNVRLAATIARQTVNVPQQRTADPSDGPRPVAYRGTYIGDRAKLAGYPMELSDRIGEANLGLVDAVDKRLPGKGASFSHYAGLRIEGQLLKGIGAYGLADGAAVKQAHVTALKKISQAEADHPRGVQASSQEIAAATELSIANVREIRRGREIHREVSSWEHYRSDAHDDHDPFSHDVTLLPEDLLADPDEDVFSQVNEFEIETAIDKVLRTLPEHLEQILVQYYGLRGQEKVSLTDISQELGIHLSLASQMKKKALNMLRRQDRSRKLYGLLDGQDFEDTGDEYDDHIAERFMTEKNYSARIAQRQAAVDAEKQSASVMRQREEDRLFKAIDNDVLDISVASWQDPDGPSRHAYLRAETNRDQLSAEVLEKLWNERLPAKLKTDFYNSERFTTYFFGIAERVLAEGGVMILNMPASADGLADGIARDMTHGRIEVNGSVGNYCAERISGSAEVIVHGDAGYMAGASMSGDAVLEITGSVGDRAAYSMSGNGHLRVGGDAGRNFGEYALNGRIEVGGAIAHDTFSDQFAGTVTTGTGDLDGHKKR